MVLCVCGCVGFLSNGSEKKKTMKNKIVKVPRLDIGKQQVLPSSARSPDQRSWVLLPFVILSNSSASLRLLPVSFPVSDLHWFYEGGLGRFHFRICLIDSLVGTGDHHRRLDGADFGMTHPHLFCKCGFFSHSDLDLCLFTVEMLSAATSLEFCLVAKCAYCLSSITAFKTFSTHELRLDHECRVAPIDHRQLILTIPSEGRFQEGNVMSFRPGSTFGVCLSIALTKISFVFLLSLLENYLHSIITHYMVRVLIGIGFVLSSILILPSISSSYGGCGGWPQLAEATSDWAAYSEEEEQWMDMAPGNRNTTVVEPETNVSSNDEESKNLAYIVEPEGGTCDEYES